MLKRWFDLFWSLIGLVLLLPVFMLVAILIKLDDGGPVFFRQTRVGWRGRTFQILKFRTMIIDAGLKGASLTVGKDPRVTKVGQWLRSSKIDELPQLINVIVGDMSLVGPRPEVPKYVNLYTNEQRKVLDLRPGITDLASVKFRNESEILGNCDDPDRVYIEKIMPEKIKLNLSYSAKASLLNDFRIILLTLGIGTFPD